MDGANAISLRLNGLVAAPVPFFRAVVAATLLLGTVTSAVWAPLGFLAASALGSAGAWPGMAALALRMLAMPRLLRVRTAAAPVAG